MNVSVIIPTYNHYHDLKSCLASVKKQSLKDIEIIVVDDGSTDETAAFVAHEQGIRVVTLPQDGGTRSKRRAAAARNAGAAVAHGEYLFFCDADVRLRPKALTAFTEALDSHPEASFAYCSFIWGWRWFRAVPFDPERLKKLNYISTMSMIRRAAFPGFDDTLDRYQDWDLWLRVVASGRRGIPLSQTLFRVTRHPDEISYKSETQGEALAKLKAKHHLT